MSRFRIHSTPISGLNVLTRYPIGDARGYLERLFCQDELQTIIGDRHIVQINHTFTSKTSTLRGMHFQHPPYAEAKLVTCLRGEIFDVAVDLRQGSPTLLQWHGERLGASNHRALFIPEGFAHGFQTLTDNCELIYFHTVSYQPDAEDGLDALDPKFGIDWPLPVAERSARDQSYSPISNAFTGIIL